MESILRIGSSNIHLPHVDFRSQTIGAHSTSSSLFSSKFLFSQICLCNSSPGSISPKLHLADSHHSEEVTNNIAAETAAIPTMSDVIRASKRQKLDLQLQTLGPLFRITAKSLDTNKELGRAEGLIRHWLEGKILHLDSIRLSRDSLGMEKSIFGIGLFIGAVAVRYGYDCGCNKAELLAINDTDLYHSKLVRFYTRIGFKAVHEVCGSSIGDLGHMLVWGGVGTRMDANVEELLIKWCTRFKISPSSESPSSSTGFTYTCSNHSLFT